MVTIALLQNNTLPYKAYFDDIEPIFRSYGGRPHWGKIHSLKAEELRPLYPRWEHFREVRRRFDPDGTFLNPYVEQLLGLG